MIPGEGAGAHAALTAAAAAWSAWTARAFTTAYVARLQELNPALLGSDRSAHALLLQAWLVEKVMYEIGYELNARPDWLGIPLGALRALAEHGMATAGTGQGAAP
jgi:maltose alpha-D-glucosyltransferase/alpha-amylase